ESTAYAQLGALAARQSIKALVKKAHLAACCRQHAGNKIEGRAFSGAIGPDQPHDFSSLQAEADVVDRDQTTEFLAYGIDLKYQRAFFRSPALRQRGRGWWRRHAPPLGGAGQCRPPRRKYRPHAIPGILQHQYHQYAKYD